MLPEENAMSVFYPRVKRKLSPSTAAASQAQRHGGLICDRGFKRYKLELATDDEMQENFGLAGDKFASSVGQSVHPTAETYVKIPTKAEAVEMMKKETYMRQMKSMLKREQENYLAQLRAYSSRAVCGARFLHSAYEGDGDCDIDIIRKKGDS